MKKIVALVLTLVLALSLSAVAFAAAVPGEYQSKATSAGATLATVTSIEKTAAVAPKDTDSDGLMDANGNVEYYTIDGTEYVKVAAVGDADLIVYYKGTTSVFGYFKATTAAACAYLGNGVVFTNFGKNCGQENLTPVSGETYYTLQNGLYVTSISPTAYLMVSGKLVGVESVVKNTVAHAWAYTTNDKNEITAVKCAKGDITATIVANYASLPEAAVTNGTFLATPDATGHYFYWNAGTTAGSTVDSAKTFDAGIAMYVGMSLMAVTGSAVVIGKKKEF